MVGMLASYYGLRMWNVHLVLFSAALVGRECEGERKTERHIGSKAFLFVYVLAGKRVFMCSCIVPNPLLRLPNWFASLCTYLSVQAVREREKQRTGARRLTKQAIVVEESQPLFPIFVPEQQLTAAKHTYQQTTIRMRP
jgi:hypothetical protein